MNANFAQGDINQGINPSIIISSPNVICECGNKVFIEAVILKKVSPLVTGSPTESLYPIPVYQCSKCGKIPAGRSLSAASGPEKGSAGGLLYHLSVPEGSG